MISRGSAVWRRRENSPHRTRMETQLSAAAERLPSEGTSPRAMSWSPRRVRDMRTVIVGSALLASMLLVLEGCGGSGSSLEPEPVLAASAPNAERSAEALPDAPVTVAGDPNNEPLATGDADLDAAVMTALAHRNAALAGDCEGIGRFGPPPGSDTLITQAECEQMNSYEVYPEETYGGVILETVVTQAGARYDVAFRVDANDGTVFTDGNYVEQVGDQWRVVDGYLE